MGSLASELWAFRYEAPSIFRVESAYFSIATFSCVLKQQFGRGDATMPEALGCFMTRYSEMLVDNIGGQLQVLVAEGERRIFEVADCFVCTPEAIWPKSIGQRQEI